MDNKVVEIPANLVKAGDVLVYSNREYLIVKVLRFSSVVQLQYSGGYYNFEFGRIVKVLDRPPASETPTIEFSNQITPIVTPVFLPVEESKKQKVSDEEDVLGKDVEVGDVIWVNNNWATVTNVYKHPHSPANKVNVDYGNVKGLQVRLALTGTFSRKVRAVMETLNIQNAIEAQRILLQKLEQMLEAILLEPGEDGKIAVVNTSFRVDKATVVKVTRDEMKAAASKSAELIKKL